MLPRPAARVLPVRIGLVAGETRRSLLARLAHANHLTADDLQAVLGCGQRRRGGADPGGLAELSGHGVDRLRRVLWADHAGSGETRLACRRCVARHGIVVPVELRRSAHQPLCRRHRRWLCLFDERGWHRHHAVSCQPDLRELPEVLAAQRRHARLAERHQVSPAGLLVLQRGWQDAQYVLRRWTGRGDWPQHRTRRLRRLLDPDHGRISEHHPLAAVVNYPETVALTELLLDPSWTEQVAGHGAPGWRRFVTEVGRRLRIDYTNYYAWEPLRRVIEQRTPGR